MVGYIDEDSEFDLEEFGNRKGIWCAWVPEIDFFFKFVVYSCHLRG